MKAIPIAVLLSFVVILAVPSAHAQEEPTIFSLSPSDFTIRDAPPQGEPYLLERKLVIRNGDAINRFFLLSVRAPPPENLDPGYEPIPNENWFILMPILIEIEENSSDMVDMGLDIPRWENLTGQQWEAWISVTRMAEPGEVIEIELICKAKIITTEELPELPSQALPLSTIIIIAVVVGVAAVIIGAWVWWKRKAGSVGGGAFSRSWG